MTNQKDRIQNAINHIKSSVDIDPWAMEIAVEAMRKELERSGQSENQDVTDINVGSTDVISRQAAIDALDVLCQEHRYKIPGKQETYSQYNEAWQDALDRAEGAIFNLPSVQSEPCEDAEFWQKRAEYYSKICLDLIAGMNQGVKIDSIEINEEGINFKMTQPEPCEDAVSRNAIFKNLTRWIDTTQGLPSAQLERPKGEWIPQDHNKSNGCATTSVYYFPKCSECGHCANYTNFCPNCGADMRGEQNETD